MDTYVAHLAGQGKASAVDVRSVFKVHLPDTLKAIPAGEVTQAQLIAEIRRVSEAGKTRTAGILRSYLIAAFNLAVGAQSDATAPSDLIAFQLTHNPARDIKAIPVGKGDRHLRIPELKRYLEALTQSTNLVDQALLLALLAGGQRISQTIRAKVSDFDDTQGALRLWDPKGRRVTPREHLIPLGARAAKLVEGLVDRAIGKAGADNPDPLLFVSTGQVGLNLTTASHRVSEISARLGGVPFTLRDVRRTVETQLAKLGIAKDIRAQLMSHGLGGVQNLHYDRHGYMHEKSAVLDRWEQHLAAIESGDSASNVHQFRRVETAS